MGTSKKEEAVNMQQEILRFIKKAARRVNNQRMIQHLLQGVMISLGCCLLLIIIGLMVAIPYTPEKCLIIVTIGIGISIGYSIFRTPKLSEIALMLDQTGLQERVSTVLMLIKKEDSLSQLQREDTIAHIKNYDLKAHFPMRFSTKKLMMVIALLAACVLIFMIPTKARQVEKQVRGFDEQKNEIVKEIEKQEKLLEKESLSEQQKKQVAKLLEKAKQEIPKADQEEEIEKTMERLSKKLENMTKELEEPKVQQTINKLNQNLTRDYQNKMQQKAKSDLDSLIKKLSKNEQTKDLAQSLKQDKNQEESNQEENQQNNEEQTQEKQALANTLSQAAANLNSSQLAAQLNSASAAISSGQFNTIGLQTALANLKNAAQVMQNSGQINGNGSNTSGANGQNGNGQGNNGSGNGSGQGNNGNGQGGQGNGWNKGSKQGKEEKSTGDTKKAPIDEGQGYNTNLTGQVNQNANIQQSEVAYGINIAGEKVDYHSVVGDYTDEALESIDQKAIPENMKEAVKDYFEAINQ